MKIHFLPSSEYIQKTVSHPKPSKIYLPDWYKKIENFHRKEPVWGDDGSIMNKNLKMCQPFLDAMCFGYVQETWCDIYVEKNENQIVVRYAGDLEIFIIRENISINNDNYFYPAELAWIQPWIPKTEKGYSCLITSPINHFNLPFETTSGVVDSDTFYSQPFGKIPFYIKNNFLGLIPAGTPMYQIIPFKRQDFSSNVLDFDEDIFIKGNKYQNRKFWGSYKKFFWQKKNFY
jgi:hypothetical protein